MMRFALLGYGAIGKVRAQALRKTAGAVLGVIAESVAERRAEAAARFKVPVASSVDELLQAEVDAVIVSTPPNLHAAQCEALLNAGKHVLCEKPLAPAVDACRTMIQAAERNRRVLATGFNYRFYSAVAKARELIAAGRIGEVEHVKGFAGHPGGPEFTHAWVHDPSIMGGGALMDNGIHAADLTLHFLGEVTEACGFTSERVWGFRGSEDNGYVLMRTAAGRLGSLHASWTEWRGYRFYVDIYGTRGAIRVWYPPMLTILYERRAGSAKRGRRKIFFFPMMQVQERLRSYLWTVEQSFVAEQLDFMQRVAGGSGVGASGVDGLRAVELVSSAYGRAANVLQRNQAQLGR
jgi:predicted dehydrogenase